MTIHIDETKFMKAKTLARTLDFVLQNDAQRGKENALVLSEILLEVLDTMEEDE